MATDKQIQANRRNAQRSTGPRSAQGKAASRWNALKSGIDAQLEILPGEDPQAHAALVQSFRDAYRPAHPAECHLVDALANAEWQLRRLRRLEANLYWSASNPAEAFLRNPNQFDRLYTRQESANRCFHRTLHHLIGIQTQRRANPEIGFVPEISSAPLQPPPEPAPAPPTTPEIGFVPQISSATQPPPQNATPAPPPAPTLSARFAKLQFGCKMILWTS